jgi:4-hydroxy-2-oxoheptanedioate aldolase
VRKNTFKAAIAPKPNQKRQIGLWTGLRSTLVAEMISHTSGLDWFVIDMEHGPNEVNDVLLQLQASQYGNAEPVVRIPWNEPVIVKRVLDLGAQSLIFPWVNTAEEARKAVQATQYPAGGIRGVMSLARMNGFGAQNPHYYTQASSQICNIVQIETLEACNNIEEIAAVDGIDALFVGPSDLSASMGYIGQGAHPEVKAKIAECFERIGKTGKASGFLTANHDDCKWALSLGCNFVAIGSDMQILATQTRAYAADFKKFCEDKL